jgi:catechol 2,3-dioxygenase-like lactoylglutathione lyase family enzyme
MLFSRRGALAAAILFAAAMGGGCASQSAETGSANADEPIVRGISYVGVSVSDLDKAASFFTAAGGLIEVDRSDIRSGALDRIAGKRVAARTRTFRSSSGQLRLMEFSEPAPDARAAGYVPVQGPGITHVCFQSPDAKPIFPRYVAAGARPVSRTGDLVQLRPDVPVKYGYLRDGDGTMIEVEQLMLDNLPFEHRMRHVAIASPDIDRVVGFYAALLGKAPRERRSGLVNPTLDLTADLDDVKLDAAWFAVGNLELEIWEFVNPAPSPPTTPRPLEAYGHNMIVFDVTDAAAAMQAAQAAGGVRLTGPSKMDGGTIAFARDPDGNLIGFFEPGSAASPFSTQGLAY